MNSDTSVTGIKTKEQGKNMWLVVLKLQSVFQPTELGARAGLFREGDQGSCYPANRVHGQGVI
jgi:hypothetical protein